MSKTSQNGVVRERVHLSVPVDILEKVREAAADRGLNAQGLINRFIILGLMAVDAENTPGDAIIIKRNGTNKNVVLL